MKKRVLSMLLAVAMLASMLAVGASAAQYTDTEGHWGEKAINIWTERGIVKGMGDGTYDPDGKMTRAQAASVFSNLLKLSKKGDVSRFTDMAPGAWYTDVIARCVSRGILQGTGETTMSPNALLTREQMLTMYGRAIGIQPEATATKSFGDSGKISSWAAGYINALVNKGYVNGVSDTEMAPKMIMGRAMVMALVDNSIGEYITEPGTYDVSQAKAEDGTEKIVLVASDGVTLSGEIANVVVASPERTEEGKERPTVKLENATVKEAVTLLTDTEIVVGKGGKVESVKQLSTAGGAVVTAETSTSSVGTVIAESNDITVQGQGSVEQLVLSSTGSEKTNATINGKVAKVSVETENAKVDGTGTISEVNVTGAAANKTANVETNVATEKLNVTAENAKITGTGAVKEANIKAESGNAQSVEIANNVDKINVGTDKSTVKTTGDIKAVAVDADEVTIDIAQNANETVVTTSAAAQTTTVNGEKVYQSSSKRIAPVAKKAATIAGHTHQFGDWEVIENPDCWVPGLQRRTCVTCGETDEELIPAQHTPESAPVVLAPATCEEAGMESYKCGVCGQQITEEIPALGHDWDEGVVTTPATDTTNGVKTYTCTRDASHTRTEEIPATGHTWDAGVVTTPATCETEGVKTFTCTSGDGATYTETIPALGHDWDEGVETTPATCEKEGVKTFTCKNASTHTKTEAIPATGHTLTKTEAKSATCTVDGNIAYWTCDTCKTLFKLNASTLKKEKTTLAEVTIPATGHTWDAGVVTTPATETADGVKTYTCSKCGATYTETLPKLAHETHAWNDGVVTTPATCTTEGVKTFTCSTCGAKKTEVITALGHSYSVSGSVPAGCETDGSVTYVCANDPAHTYTDVIPATGHVWNDGENTKTPTCTTAGEKTFTCTNCSATKIEFTPALGHDLVHHEVKAATCTGFGWDAYDTCTRCDYTTYKVIPALGHKLTKTEAVPATCTTAGNIAYWTCSVCNKIFSDEAATTEVTDVTVPATDHDWDDGVITTPATDTEDGVMTYTCKNDPTHVRTEVIPAHVHSLTKTDAVAATCEAAGNIAYWTCSGCGKTFSDEAGTTEVTDVTIPATGHDWGKAVVTLKPTATEAGSQTYTCKNDPTHTKTETIAAGTAYFEVEKVTAKANDTVDVTISFHNNPGIAAIQLDVAYDDDLTLTNVAFAPEFGGAGTAESLVSPATLGWFNMYGDTTGDKTFATLTFKVDENAEVGEKAITLEFDPAANVNYNAEVVPFIAIDSAVEVAAPYSLYLKIENADGSKSVDGSRVSYLDNEVLAEAMYILNENFDADADYDPNGNKALQLVFSGADEYNSLKDMIKAYYDEVNGDTNATKSWATYVGESTENTESLVSLKDKFATDVHAKFSELGKNTWVIGYTVNENTYKVTMTIS